MIKYSHPICMGVYNGLPSACHCKRPYRSDANILSTTNKFRLTPSDAMKYEDEREHNIVTSVIHSFKLNLSEVTF